MNTVQLVQMPKNFTISEVDSIQQTITSYFQKEDKLQHLILDFAKTNFIDSSGIVCLRQIFQAAKTAKVDLIGWSLSPQVKRIIFKADLAQFLHLKTETENVIRTNGNEQENLIHPSVSSKTKRIIDIIGALVGLGITGILSIPIALAIKWESPGAIFFSQVRCGYQGRTFKIWKFRSMIANAEQLKSQIKNQATGPIFKNENDPRITHVGRFLRKTSLDEFPQFWNVLVGEMSLVGTRPPTLAEVDQYEIVYGQRLNVKPGLTGEWQVNGRSKINDFSDILDLDLKYQKNWSIFYDIKLIIKTLTKLFSRNSGAC